MARAATLPSWQPYGVVVVPFPFTDRKASKRRPALVLSSEAFNQDVRHVVLAMITSAEQSAWMGDYEIKDLTAAGLPAACVVRLRLFTLDNRLILRSSGRLSPADQKRLRLAWKPLLTVP